MLYKVNKLKLPKVRCPNEVGRTNDTNYCLFHKMVHHPTSKYFVLKDKIQALGDTGVLILKSEQKKVTVNMVTLNFETFTKATVQDGVTPVLKSRLDVISTMAKVQKARGLILMVAKSGEIMWVHPDIVNAEQ